jgi:electron transfer flavoprotein beta subunit
MRAKPIEDGRKEKSMKILVSLKQVLDYNLRPRIKADGTGVDLASARLSMNPFDERAVEEAVRLKEKGIASEVVVVSVGPAKVQETLRTGLAMGADRAILVQTAESVEPLAVAKLLKGVAAEEQPDLIILGKQAIDDDASQTGQMLAALLRCPQGTFVSALDVEDGFATVTREVDGGLQTLALKLPAVVTVDLRLNAPRRPSLPEVMKAKSKPLLTRVPGDYDVDVTPRLQLISVAEPPRRTHVSMVATVDQLAAKLRDLGLAA